LNNINAKIRLISDFLDYYDHWFDVYDASIVFERMSRGGMSRPEMLSFLKSLGLKVPFFGRVKDVYKYMLRKYEDIPYVDSILSVVVHLDERAHCGEGKVQIPLCEAMEKYPDCFAVEYIPAQPSGLGLSWRYLQIGNKIFWLEFASRNDWRSNCGQVDIKVLSREQDGYHERIKYPLFAVDFIPADNLYAVDFNIAPQIRGTGVEELLPAREAAEAIKRAIVELQT
jgi:hypothetical protein